MTTHPPLHSIPSLPFPPTRAQGSVSLVSAQFPPSFVFCASTSPVSTRSCSPCVQNSCCFPHCTPVGSSLPRSSQGQGAIQQPSQPRLHAHTFVPQAILQLDVSFKVAVAAVADVAHRLRLNPARYNVPASGMCNVPNIVVWCREKERADSVCVCV
ncbi:hypothetical protein LZ30DRAFT_32272 [Colletotrichum cereale]|nr:hypothetical protein LZ30DRAFT_32272 [Colletotrichum cereale]